MVKNTIAGSRQPAFKLNLTTPANGSAPRLSLVVLATGDRFVLEHNLNGSSHAALKKNLRERMDAVSSALNAAAGGGNVPDSCRAGTDTTDSPDDLQRLITHAAEVCNAVEDGDDNDQANEAWRALPDHLVAAIEAEQVRLKAEATAGEQK